LNGQFGAVFRRQSHHAANFIDAHANNFALYAKDNDNAWSVLILRTRAQQRGKIEHRHNRPAQINRAKHLGHGGRHRGQCFGIGHHLADAVDRKGKVQGTHPGQAELVMNLLAP
jgi:hypothetical protein